MFNYKQKISVLDSKQDIISAKMQIDADGLPSVSWIQSKAESNFLNFCRYDGSEWQFNDEDFEISKTIDFFDFLLTSTDTYFCYNYAKNYSSDTYLEYKKYSFSDNLFSDPVVLDYGDIKFCKPFYYVSDVYFFYIMNGYIVVRDSGGSLAIPEMSTLLLSGNITQVKASFCTRFFLLTWCVENLGSVSVNSCLFDFVNLSWSSISTVASFDSVSYSTDVAKNNFGDVVAPASSYKPFYLAISRREGTEIKISLVEYDIFGDYVIWAVYNKKYFDFKTDFSEVPKVNISVYGQVSALSVVCEDVILLHSDNIQYGYVKQFCPGQDNILGLSGFVPIVNEGVFHYLYVSDNLSYGYTSYDYFSIRSNCNLLISNPNSTYVTPSQNAEIGACDVLDVVYDRSFELPFLYLVKAEDDLKVLLYNCNSNSYITDVSIETKKPVTRCLFDKKYSKCIFKTEEAQLSIYDIGKKTTTDYPSFDSIDLGPQFDFCFDDKEIFVADTENDRVIALDRSSYQYLRTIKNDNMIKPYSCVCGTDSTVYVKCYNKETYPIVFKYNRIGDLLASFPSYSPYPLSQTDYESWAFIASSFSSDKVAMIFKSSSQLLIIDDHDGSWIQKNLAGYSVHGVAIDGKSGHLFVSAINASSLNVVLEVDPVSGEVVCEHRAYNYGFVSVIGQDACGIVAQFSVDSSKYSTSTSIESIFAGVSETSTVDALLKSTNVGEDSRDYSFTKLVYEQVGVVSGAPSSSRSSASSAPSSDNGSVQAYKKTFSSVTGVQVSQKFLEKPIVQVIDNAGDQTIPKSIHFNDDNSFSVTFGSNTSGTVLAYGTQVLGSSSLNSSAGSKANETSSTAVEYSMKHGIEHTTTRDVKANIWHFRFNGLYGEKISVDPNLSFSYLQNGDLTRVPAFCWEFEESSFVDSFFVSDGFSIKKMTILSDGTLKEIASTYDVNKIDSIFVSDGKVFVTSGGYLSVFSYDSLNRLEFQYFCNGIKVYDYRNGYIWAGSKARGYIYKIDINDLSVFNTIESQEAPVNMIWSDYFFKYILHCENSLKFLDESTLLIENFYDINEYVIKDISVNNNKIAICSLSYDKIPRSADYTDQSLFLVDAKNRRCDRVSVYVPRERKYVYEHDLEYDFVSNSIDFTGNVVTLLGSVLTKVQVKAFDIATGIGGSYSYTTELFPVDMIYMPVESRNFAVISDGSILDWSGGSLESVFSGEDYKNPSEVLLASNGLLVSADGVSSAISSSDTAQFRSVQIIVGDSTGTANKWDSGEVLTSKKCILYGGGKNLEPGQRYYVAIRHKSNSGVWCQYSSLDFVMPHFENFVTNRVSSSSSSSNSVKYLENQFTLYPGGSESIGIFSSYGVIFAASSGEYSYIEIESVPFKVENSAGKLIFDSGGSQEYTFSFVGDTFVLYVGFNQYIITLVSEESLVFSIYVG
jgi:hypothetical protein